MMTTRERRRSPRVAVDVPIELRFTLDPVVRGRASDLSREGLFAETEEPRPPGTLVRVRIDDAAAEPVMAVGGVGSLVPSHEDPAPSRRRTGVTSLLSTASSAKTSLLTGLA